MITPHRRLRRGRSLWTNHTGVPIRAERLPLVQLADVAVIGAGISGALCALELARDGHQVLVLDRRLPVTGSTLASTAMIQFEIDEPLSRLDDRLPGTSAARAWRRSQLAVRALQRLVTRERVRCGMAPRHTLYLAGNDMGAGALQNELQVRQRAGLGGEWINSTALQHRYGIERGGAILSANAASVNPVQLTHGLLRRATALGTRVYAPANVVHAESTRGGVWLEVDTNCAVFAQHVVFCTGYELLADIPAPKYEVVSTWAMAGRLDGPTPAWLRRTLLWEASTPYLYLRLHGHDIIAGGRDEQHATRYTVRGLLARKQRFIEQDVAKLLPTVNWRATHAWSGAFATSPTGLPIIDRVPGMPRAWVVAGLGGNGITFSMIAAQIVRQALRGQTDPDARLFRM